MLSSCYLVCGSVYIDSCLYLTKHYVQVDLSVWFMPEKRAFRCFCHVKFGKLVLHEDAGQACVILHSPESEILIFTVEKCFDSCK